MTNAQRITIRKLQATLAKINTNQPVFFNLANFLNMDLVKQHGKNANNTDRWILTEKGKEILKVTV